MFGGAHFQAAHVTTWTAFSIDPGGGGVTHIEGLATHLLPMFGKEGQPEMVVATPKCARNASRRHSGRGKFLPRKQKVSHGGLIYNLTRELRF